MPKLVTIYRADWTSTNKPLSPWRPSIHMPRWASRITLKVTGVRVERVTAISEEDAVAEGFERREHFARYWDDIHGPLAFDRNDWAWVVEFQRRDSLTVERVR